MGSRLLKFREYHTYLGAHAYSFRIFLGNFRTIWCKNRPMRQTRIFLMKRDLGRVVWGGKEKKNILEKFVQIGTTDTWFDTWSVCSNRCKVVPRYYVSSYETHANWVLTTHENVINITWSTCLQKKQEKSHINNAYRWRPHVSTCTYHV